MQPNPIFWFYEITLHPDVLHSIWQCRETVDCATQLAREGANMTGVHAGCVKQCSLLLDQTGN